MLRRKIGEFDACGFTTPVWGNFFKGPDNQPLITIYWTRNNSPKNEPWYKSLQEDTGLNIKYIKKGSYQYGYYYKILITHRLDTFKKLFSELQEWICYEEEDNKKLIYKFNITKDLDYLVNEKIIDEL